MGLYFQPDGPCLNAAELLPLGKIDEAREAQEQACEYLTDDLDFVGSELAEVGLEGLNFDTSGSAGDADIYGMAVNTVTTESVPWNLARAVTFLKATTAVADIPVHANVGMGVCGIPMMEQPPH
jgi:dimethylamine--corrinoid protein Co-methyltransferase